MKTRTSSPDLCTWTRAPSSFHSRSARAELRERASATSSAGCASIGSTGCISRIGERVERPRAAVERRARDRRDAAGEGRRAAHVRRRQAGRRGDRLEHHALERALAQLADDQPQQEVLLFRRGLLEQLLQQRLRVRAAAPLPLRALESCEGAVDVAAA